jgi:hypothetical protein
MDDTPVLRYLILPGGDLHFKQWAINAARRPSRNIHATRR